MSSSEISLYSPIFPSDWYRMPLYEIADWLNGLTLRSADLEQAGIPIIKITEVKSGVSSQTKYSTQNFDAQYLIKNGDVLFCWSGQPETSIDTFKWNGVPGWLNQHIFKVTPKADVISHDFLYYLLKYLRPTFISIAGNKQTTGLGHVTKGDLKRIEVALPSLKIQKHIVQSIKPIDDRIALLRENNATLEAIAQALFKSWFVDFDPVRAKQDGRLADGMDEASAALFPASFEESGKRKVPSGWTTLSVYDLATYINGAAYKAFEPNLERRGSPIIKIAELKTGVTAQTAYSDVAMAEKYRILNGDILFSWSGNPDTSIDTFVWSGDSAWLNQHIFRVLPHSVGERSFLLQTLRYLRPIFTELARNKQTTGLGHVTVADLKRLQIIKPEPIVLEHFDSLVAPIHDRIFKNDQLVQNYVALRDALLPRLFIGQLLPPEASEPMKHAA
jgi:type I restriction enzyme S subunit